MSCPRTQNVSPLRIESKFPDEGNNVFCITISSTVNYFSDLYLTLHFYMMMLCSYDCSSINKVFYASVYLLIKKPVKRFCVHGGGRLFQDT